VIPTNPEPASKVRLPPRSWDLKLFAGGCDAADIFVSVTVAGSVLVELIMICCAAYAFLRRRARLYYSPLQPGAARKG
jgi:hypothetical protein